MIPVENRSSLDRFQKQPERLCKAVERAGRLTASSQLRGGRFKPGATLARPGRGPREPRSTQSSLPRRASPAYQPSARGVQGRHSQRRRQIALYRHSPARKQLVSV